MGGGGGRRLWREGFGWDWTEGRIKATVIDRTKDLATPVEFTVTPGDGTSEKAFLRIRK